MSNYLDNDFEAVQDALTEIGLEAARECVNEIERKYPGRANKWEMPEKLQQEYCTAKNALSLGKLFISAFVAPKSH